MDEAYLDTAHLFRRAGFGALHQEIEQYKTWDWNDLVGMVLDSGRAPTPPPLPNLSSNSDSYGQYVDMVHYWLDLARRPVNQAPVVEKMVLFWHGLLCSALGKVHNHQILMEQNQLFRRDGLGDYRTLLQRVSIGSAMVLYLDNDQNVVGKPNENFSRELMELFVTGLGHYSETDVKESARAWTGHGVDDNDNYRFDASAHDGGIKTFMGQRGNFDGPDIINILLDRRRSAHARFMCHRLWSFFAYPVDLNHWIVTDLMATYQVGLNIRDTLRAIFLHPKFRSEQARNGLIRSPIEYVVAVMRHANMDSATVHPEWFLPGMGQRPFDPPNVSGWRQNEYWISDSAAWSKLNLANQVRWAAYRRDDILQTEEVSGYNPLTFKFTPNQSVNNAIANYGLGSINVDSYRKLVDFVKTERASDHRWTERAGLLMIPLLLPELQMA